MSKISSTENNRFQGQRLIAIRESTNLTQIDFVKRLGLSIRAYINYERGEREMPAALPQLLYEKFNIDPLWLLAGSGTTPVYATDRRANVELVARIVLLIDQQLQRRHAKLSMDKKIRLAKLIYEHCTDDSVNEVYLKEMVALMA